MTPIEMYNAIFFKHISFLASIIGVDVTKSDYKVNGRTYFWVFINILCTFSNVYTICVYDIDTKMKTCTFIGIGIQGFFKWGIQISCAAEIRQKVLILNSMYMSNQDQRNVNYATLHNWSRGMYLFTKYGAYPVSFVMAVFLMFPLVLYFRNGVWELILPLFLPGLDDTTVWGYVALNALNILILMLGVFGTCATDFTVVVLVLHMWPMTYIFEAMFGTLNKALAKEKNRGSLQQREYFRNLVYIHKDICSYLEGISDTYFYLIFSEVYTDAECLCGILYSILAMTWYPVYFLWLLMFTKLLFYCCVGTMAELATDRVYATLVDSNWYLLPLDEQLQIRLMILKSQNPTILMAGTLPLMARLKR